MNIATKKIGIGLLALSFISVFLIWNWDEGREEYMNYNPEFDRYLSAYTAGEVSSNSILKVRFIEDIVSAEDIGKSIGEEYYQIEPAIEGETFWMDERTIAFRPFSPLKKAQFYKAKLKVNILIAQAPEYFKFGFGQHQNKWISGSMH